MKCPGTRKMLKSFMKLPKGSILIRNVNEFRTSRLCARCFTPFPLATLSHRFKVCEFCLPDQDDWPLRLKLPSKIVTKKSKRMYQTERKEMREAMIANPDVQGVGFVSTMKCYRKNWRQNWQQNGLDNNPAVLPGAIIDNDYDFTADYVPEDFFDVPIDPILKTVWQRDITAAKLIMYRGECLII